ALVRRARLGVCARVRSFGDLLRRLSARSSLRHGAGHRPVHLTPPATRRHNPLTRPPAESRSKLAQAVSGEAAKANLRAGNPTLDVFPRDRPGLNGRRGAPDAISVVYHSAHADH